MPKGRKLIFKGYKKSELYSTSCDYFSTSETGIKFHMSKIHNVDGRLNKMNDHHSCSICGYESSIFGIRKHMLIHY